MRISDWSSDVCSSDLITKPSLYRLFGDKRALFLRALERYAQTHGSPAIEAFDAAQRIEDSVAAFLNAAIETQTGDGGPKIGRAHSELQSLMRISYALFCLKKKNHLYHTHLNFCSFFSLHLHT